MNANFKSSWKVISTDFHNYQSSEFETYLEEMNAWILSISSPKQSISFWRSGSSEKKILFSCITALANYCANFSTETSFNFDAILEIFSYLLNPYNTIEIIKLSFEQMLKILIAFAEKVQIQQWKENFDRFFVQSNFNEVKRINIGSKSSTPEEMFIVCNKCLTFCMNSQDDDFIFYYLFRLASQTFLNYLQIKEENKVEISSYYVDPIIRNLKIQENFSPLASIPGISRSAILPFEDEIIYAIMTILINIASPYNTNPETTEYDQLAIKFLDELLPVDLVSYNIDNSKLPNDRYRLAEFLSSMPKRTIYSVQCICKSLKVKSIISLFFQISARLFYTFNQRVSEDIIRHCFRMQHLLKIYAQTEPNQPKLVDFIKISISSLPQVVPQMLTLFLMHLYETRFAIGKTKLDEIEKIFKDGIKSSKIECDYNSIVVTFASQLAMVFSRPLFNLNIIMHDLESNPVLYNANFGENPLTNPFLSKNYTADLFYYFPLNPCELRQNAAIECMNLFLDSFSKGDCFNLPFVISERLLDLMSKLKPSVSIDPHFITTSLLNRLIDAANDEANVLDLPNYLLAIKRIVCTKKITRHINMKSMIKIYQLLIHNLQNPNSDSFNSVYFAAISIVLKGEPSASCLIPFILFQTDKSFDSAKGSLQQKFLFSFLISALSMIRVVKTISIPTSFVEKYKVPEKISIKDVQNLIITFITKHLEDSLSQLYLLDALTNVLFIDEVLHSNEPFNQEIWNVFQLLLKKSIQVNEIPYFILSFDSDIIEKCQSRVDQFATLLTESVVTILKKGNPVLFRRCLIFASNIIKLTGKSHILIDILRRVPELFQIRCPNEFNLLIASYNKPIRTLKNKIEQKSNDILIINERESYILGAKIDENSATIFNTSNLGSSKYDIQFGTQIKMNYTASNEFVSFLSTLKGRGSILFDLMVGNNQNDLKCINKMNSAKFMIFPLSDIAQRRPEVISRIPILAVNEDVSQISDLSMVKWENCTEDFRNFVSTLGCFYSPEQFTKNAQIANLMYNCQSVISYNTHYYNIFNIIPIMASNGYDIDFATKLDFFIVYELGDSPMKFKQFKDTASILFVSKLASGFYKLKLSLKGEEKIPTFIPKKIIVPKDFVPIFIMNVIKHVVIYNDKMFLDVQALNEWIDFTTN